jgi:hypothetical protein
VAFVFAWHHGLTRVCPTTDRQTDTSCVLQCNQHEITNGATQLTGWTCFVFCGCTTGPATSRSPRQARYKNSCERVKNRICTKQRNDGAFDGSRSLISIKSERVRARLHTVLSTHPSIQPASQPSIHGSQSKRTSQASNVQGSLSCKRVVRQSEGRYELVLVQY